MMMGLITVSHGFTYTIKYIEEKRSALSKMGLCLVDTFSNIVNRVVMDVMRIYSNLV